MRISSSRETCLAKSALNEHAQAFASIPLSYGGGGHMVKVHFHFGSLDFGCELRFPNDERYTISVHTSKAFGPFFSQNHVARTGPNPAISDQGVKKDKISDNFRLLCTSIVYIHCFIYCLN